MSDAMRALVIAFVLLLGPVPGLAQEPDCEEWATIAEAAHLDAEDSSGIGGSGRASSGEDSGIGGTGRSGEDSGIGGTGIYGSITGFGSVCVNGVRVHVDENTRVSSNQRSVSEDDLAVGQVVWIEAQVEDGLLHASSISAMSAVVGSVEALASGSRLLRVSDRVVWIPEGSLLLDESGRPLPFEALQAHDRVDVHGLARADGRIEATRLQRRDASILPDYQAPPIEALLRHSSVKLVSFEGHLGERLASGAVTVAGLSLDLGVLANPKVPIGSRVYVTAAVRADSSLAAQRLSPAPLPVAPVPMPAPPPSIVVPRSGPGAQSDIQLRVTDMPQLLDPPASEPPPAPNVDPVTPGPGVITPQPTAPQPVVPQPIVRPPPILPPPPIDPVLDPVLEPKIDHIAPR